MKVLVVGSGGREHALVRQIAASPLVKEVLAAPGSAGIATLARCVDIKVTDLEALAQLAEREKVDLTVVGPEAPLAAGIVDLFTSKSLKIFGPDKYAANLEGSKIFSKEIMHEAGVPTAECRVFDEAESALAYLKTASYPIVIKADGLAAGKGVTVAANRTEAEDAVRRAMIAKEFGASGDRILIEECLIGEEASLIGVTDGKTVRLMASSQDHKRLGDGDRGPNTGGMGAYSPAPAVTAAVEKEALDKVFYPVIRLLAKRGHAFKGFLYAGIMLTPKGMRVLEFNVRFGDPEAQAVLPRLKTDLVKVIQAVVDGKLDAVELQWDSRPAVTVVLASAGYPGTPRTNDTIQGLDGTAANGVMIFHAGTKRTENRWLTAGGRVLNVSAMGSDVADACRRAYEGVSQIRFEGMQYRKDIAHRALGRLETKARS